MAIFQLQYSHLMPFQFNFSKRASAWCLKWQRNVSIWEWKFLQINKIFGLEMVKRHSGIKYFMQCQEISTTLNFQIKYLSDRAPSGNFILNLNKKGFLALKKHIFICCSVGEIKKFPSQCKKLGNFKCRVFISLAGNAVSCQFELFLRRPSESLTKIIDIKSSFAVSRVAAWLLAICGPSVPLFPGARSWSRQLHQHSSYPQHSVISNCASLFR